MNDNRNSKFKNRKSKIMVVDDTPENLNLLRNMLQERHNQSLEELVREKVRQISASQLATILSVTKLAEYRDDDTGRHIE